VGELLSTALRVPAYAASGRTQGEGRAAALAVLLRDRFLTLDPPGGWLDSSTITAAA
jgi:hypothetical protein